MVPEMHFCLLFALQAMMSMNEKEQLVPKERIETAEQR